MAWEDATLEEASRRMEVFRTAVKAAVDTCEHLDDHWTGWVWFADEECGLCFLTPAIPDSAALIPVPMDINLPFLIDNLDDEGIQDILTEFAEGGLVNARHWDVCDSEEATPYIRKYMEEYRRRFIQMMPDEPISWGTYVLEGEEGY